MGPSAPTHTSRLTARLVRKRIERGGERLWRHHDFRDLPFTPVARALSRLAASGTIERLSKGVYYRARTTSFGKSLPNPAAVQELASQEREALRLEVEHARYEAQLAGRRHERVDPDVRLVAAELEARWNAALEHVRDVEGCRLTAFDARPIGRQTSSVQAVRRRFAARCTWTLPVR